MSSVIMVDDDDSILPESSASQRFDQSTASGFSKLKSDLDSIDEYYIVKNTAECLKEAERLLGKESDSVCYYVIFLT